MKTELRTVEIKKNDKWNLTHMKDIKKGDVFRLFESTNEPVRVNDKEIFTATENASPTNGATWEVVAVGGDILSDEIINHFQLNEKE